MIKAQVLVVEDEAILYERLRRLLIKENYKVSPYTPSVKEARNQLLINRPDIVLLDIELKGTETGLDLGKELSEHHRIPFIYISQFDDYETFFSGLHTNHEQFIIKTKPRLNGLQILRAMQTVLHKNKKETYSKEGVIGLVDYLENLKKYTNSQITKVPVSFNQITYFSIKPFVNENGIEEKIKTNYLWFYTLKGDYFFLKSSLKELSCHLPNYFCRINESTIVNLTSSAVHGNGNNDTIYIGNEEFKINKTYKKLFTTLLSNLYFNE